MIIRVQSKDGTKRIEASSSETVVSFLSKVGKEFGLDGGSSWRIYQDRSRKSELKKNSKSKLSSKKLKHGDMCYLYFTDGINVAGDEAEEESEPGIGSSKCR